MWPLSLSERDASDCPQAQNHFRVQDETFRERDRLSVGGEKEGWTARGQGQEGGRMVIRWHHLLHLLSSSIPPRSIISAFLCPFHLFLSLPFLSFTSDFFFPVSPLLVLPLLPPLSAFFLSSIPPFLYLPPSSLSFPLTFSFYFSILLSPFLLLIFSFFPIPSFMCPLFLYFIPSFSFSLDLPFLYLCPSSTCIFPCSVIIFYLLSSLPFYFTHP